MKKVYTRPELFYENFSLMEAIAACPAIANHGDTATCAYYDEGFGMSFFADVNGSCEFDEKDLLSYEVNVNNIFSS